MRRLIIVFLLIAIAVLIVFFALAARSMRDAMAEVHAATDAFLASHPEATSTRAGIFSVTAGTENPYGTFVLVHGSPGDWADFGAYLADPDLTAALRIVAVDRPGYGNSPDSAHPPSLADQASRLAVWAESLPPGKHFWLGHSFGASVVAKLAMDRPDLVDGVILLAGAMDPQWEEPRWFHAIANTARVHKSLPPPVAFANDEALAYYGDLRAMEAAWSRIQCPVMIIHARDDRLADFRHVAYVRARLDPTRTEVIELQDGNHFLPWNRKPVVAAGVRRMAGLPPKAVSGNESGQ